MSKQNSLEVELRYKVHNTAALIERLGTLGVALLQKDHLIDQWFMPTDVKSQAQEHEWFDEKRGIAWRVRRTEQPDGAYAVKVESKQLSDAKNHDTFLETTADIHNYDDALTFMAGKDYRCWLTIDKTRWTFDSGNPQMEIVLDEVEGLAKKVGVGAALEVEFKGEATREQALANLGEFAATLGLDPNDRFDKSLTVEAMAALADFGV